MFDEESVVHMKELSLLKYRLIKKISILKPLQMSGHLKKIKIRYFLMDKVVIYKLSFMLFVLPNLVIFPLSLPELSSG
jgi:hypothetical protein